MPGPAGARGLVRAGAGIAYPAFRASPGAGEAGANHLREGSRPLRSSSRFKGPFALLLVLLVLGATIRWWGRIFFPLPYREAVEAQAARHGIDPLLVMAVIREESSFNPRAVSSRGAVGLMQIMPATGAWIAAQLGEDFSPAKLFDPAANIRYGTWYLHALIAEFGGDLVRALAAYNAGNNRVSEWLSVGIWDGSLERIGRLPFPETKRYLIRIRRSHAIYRFLYG